MTHNPKAPWPRRTSPVADVQDPKQAFADRVRRLGGADDVVQMVLDSWDDPDWTDRDQVVSLSDEALAAELAEIEREHYRHTHDEEEEAAERAAARLAALVAQAVDGTVDEALATLAEHDNDPELAAAILAAEHLAEKPRKTLVEPLTEIIEAATAPESDDGAEA
jgi:hypothetical protein